MKCLTFRMIEVEKYFDNIFCSPPQTKMEVEQWGQYDDAHMFMSEGEAVWVDNRMYEPVNVVNHPLVLQHCMEGPQSCGRADPFSRVNSSTF